MPPNTSMRSARPCRQQEADCRPRGWRQCCTGSNTRDQSACSSTWPGWLHAIPVQESRRNWPICTSVKRTCSTPPISKQAGRLARGVSKVPTRWSWKHGAYGAGMRWDRHNVNPMLALRNAVCNRRWNETWQAARRQRQQSRHQLRGQRIQARYEQALTRLLTLWLWFRPSTPCPVGEPAPRSVSSLAPTPAAIPPGPRRPAANHPWRRPLVVRPKEAVLAKK